MVTTIVTNAWIVAATCFVVGCKLSDQHSARVDCCGDDLQRSFGAFGCLGETFSLTDPQA